MCGAGFRLVFLNKGTQPLTAPSALTQQPRGGNGLPRHSFGPKQLQSFARTHPSTDGVPASGREGGKEETPLPSLAIGRDPERSRRVKGARRPLLSLCLPSDLWGAGSTPKPDDGSSY